MAKSSKTVSRARKAAKPAARKSLKDLAPTRGKAKKVVGGFVDIEGWDEVPLGIAAKRTIKR